MQTSRGFLSKIKNNDCSQSIDRCEEAQMSLSLRDAHIHMLVVDEFFASTEQINLSIMLNHNWRVSTLPFLRTAIEKNTYHAKFRVAYNCAKHEHNKMHVSD